MLRPDSALADAVRASPCIGPRRHGGRPDILLLHYTGMTSCERAIDWLSRRDARVSCHYVIDTDGHITQMVAESMRAWHAGEGAWAGDTDINSRSIGFEIHNPGHDHGYPDFPPAQMAAVTALARDVIARWSIRAERVIGHSDMAPHRKSDPGEKFDWAGLSAAGVGHWVPPEPVDPADSGFAPEERDAGIAAVQLALRRYGYQIKVTGTLDAPTMVVVTAFQRHFRPARIDGRIDRSTRVTLQRLLQALPSARVA